MRKSHFTGSILIGILLALLPRLSLALDLEGLALREDSVSVQAAEIKRMPFGFNGYTHHWTRSSWNWFTARGLFLDSQTTPRSDIWAMEEEIGNQLLLEELWIERGFVKELAGQNLATFDSPTLEELESALDRGDTMVAVVDRDPVAEELLAKLPEEMRFRRNRAFTVGDASHTLFVLATQSKRELEILKGHIQEALEVVEKYDLHRGVSGIHSNFLHITPGQRHNPFELVNLSLRLGCSWLSVCGFNDWMIPGPVGQALEEIDFSFPFISGQYVTGGVLYGMASYPDIQDNTVEECLDWAAEKGGYYFANLSSSGDEHADRFDGYVLSSPSDQAKIKELGKPFLTQAGEIDSGAPPTTVAFLEKGTPLSQQTLFDAIKAKRTVAVFEGGVLAGPPRLRDALRVLLLEGTCLEEALDGPVSVDAVIDEGILQVAVRNLTSGPLTGTLQIRLGKSLQLAEEKLPDPVTLEAYELATAQFPLRFSPDAYGRDNIVGVVFETGDTQKKSLAHIDLPRPVEIQPILLEVPGKVSLPLTVANPVAEATFPVSVSVRRKESGERVFSSNDFVVVPAGNHVKLEIEIPLGAGDYVAEATALGVMSSGNISVRPTDWSVSVREEDLDGDGIPEIVMENDLIRATVLLTGGRVIEYIVKSRDENLLFKLWPEKPPLDGQPGGTRSFYPFGGLEEFTGYPYIGGHIVFDYEVLESTGPRARVRVWANIHGSKIEKIYTLFSGSPVLEARYAMEDMTPTLNVFGINPLFQIGPSTGPEDRYYFPEDELVETIPELERYYGRGLFPKEGWAAGYDTEMDISLLIGFPVNDAIYLHLWNNHPDNTPTPYYYTELQPWLEIKPGTTTYFTYYILGQEGPWKPLLETFKEEGLLTKRTKTLPWSY